MTSEADKKDAILGGAGTGYGAGNNPDTVTGKGQPLTEDKPPATTANDEKKAGEEKGLKDKAKEFLNKEHEKEKRDDIWGGGSTEGEGSRGG